MFTETGENVRMAEWEN